MKIHVSKISLNTQKKKPKNLFLKCASGAEKMTSSMLLSITISGWCGQWSTSTNDGLLFQQIWVIPVGTSCKILLAELFMYLYAAEITHNFAKTNLFRYSDDVM